MEHRSIGSLSVSVVGLGCNNFGMRIDEQETKLVVDSALAAGINHFDTADIYGGTKSEEYLGRALGSRRRDIVLATKFGMEVAPDKKGARPQYVKQACADSLSRLGTEHIDLYWLHTPDDSVPLAETLGALSELIAAGKVREIGCSNFSSAQLREADSLSQQQGLPRFVAVQNELSLLVREALSEEHSGDRRSGVLAECNKLGLAFVPYFPLASGLFSGKYRKGQPVPEGSRLAVSKRGPEMLSEANLEMVERLIAWVEDYNKKHGSSHSLLELAIAWLLSFNGVASVIAGATKPGQVEANSRAGAWQLGRAEADEVLALVSQ